MLTLLMRVLNKKLLDTAKRKYSDSRKAIDGWMLTIQNIHPKNYFELKKTFSSADLVGENEILICFNIKGNHYRLIAKMDYPDTAIVKDFIKHSDYDRKYRYKGRKK